MSLLFTPGLGSSPSKSNNTSAPHRHVVALSPLALADMSSSASPHAETTHPNQQHLYVLPVLLLEFLAIALTRAVLPSLLVEKYGDNVYLVMGCADCVRGLLAFVACPIFGKLSDLVGRRLCLFVTVLGTCAPVCSLAFFPWTATDDTPVYDSDDDSGGAGFWNEFFAPTTNVTSAATIAADADAATDVHPHAITVFVVLLALSGIFSSTFTLVFAYISDTVPNRDERVSAYGLALATFGLAFTIGPMAGGYLAQTNKQYVFLTSLILTLLDLLYIYLILPESHQGEHLKIATSGRSGSTTTTSSLSLLQDNYLALSWNPVDTLRLIATDPFLRSIGQVAFFYYTALWALISTLSVYAVQRFHFTPERLGELMSALGLSTMVAEAVLVRLFVKELGEKRSIQVGLVSFALQCVVLGFAYEPWHLFVCALFSLLGNLVYPAVSSLVSASVEPEAVGEALGAVNGIKALTEGIGPLVFGSLMTLSERSALPGWPYLLASVLVAAAYKATHSLPSEEDDEYIHELAVKNRSGDGIWMQTLGGVKQPDDDEEFEGLLSEVEEESEGD